MANKKTIERFQDDIKILDRIIQRHSRELRKEKEKGVTTATTVLGEELKFLRAARRWLKTYKNMNERRRRREEEMKEYEEKI